mgnify:CR=1 FL=1
MRAYLGLTDEHWYRYLLARAPHDEVNFWAPSGARSFQAIPQGAPFLFQLKSPHNAVAGFGFLGPVTTLPLTMAWDTFEEKNGAESFDAMEL